MAEDVILNGIRDRIVRDVPDGVGVLDLATGSGLVTLAVARKAGAVIALEEYRSVLAETRDTAHSENLDAMLFLLADPRSLPLPSRSVDVVVAVNILHAYRVVGAALHEVRRVLRPGARFLSATYCHGSSPHKPIGWQDRRTAWPVRPANRFSRESLEAAIRGAGFTISGSDPVSQDPYILYVDARRPAKTATKIRTKAPARPGWFSGNRR